MTTDYRSTIFLPQTEFPMKADLAKREPVFLERWAKLDLYKRLREKAKGLPKFILHDGPPYANGNIHLGHALNRVLKDMIVRSQQMMGKDAPFVPGWDCHGLPIEWKIEEKYRKAGKNKDEVPILEFRQECRDFAQHWMDTQRAEFKRLGPLGEWDNAYNTMTPAAEAQIARELMKFLMKGALYRGSKPVMWSVVEKTALAEAEVEYHNHTSTQIDVAFPIVKASKPELEGASVVIWTTTPWTIPGNRGIAYGPEVDYVLIGASSIGSVGAGSQIRVSDFPEAAELFSKKFLVAQELVEDFKVRLSRYLTSLKNSQGESGQLLLNFNLEFGRYKGSDLVGTVCAHPLRGQGYDFDVPLIEGHHVTTEQGTGFVHIAPGHGEDDFIIGQKYGLEVPFTVSDGGTYYDSVPLFAGVHVFKADEPVCEKLAEAGALLAKGKLVHSYPHSWRSKAPLIFRNTPQWFISMDHDGLREKALKAIDDTRFVPKIGRNRIRGMVETRPDWVISRQRAWGVPITVFVEKTSGKILQDEAVNTRIAEAFEKEGADAWFASEPSRFLGNAYNPEDYEQINDVLDVWFDSGSTHAFVLESGTWPDLTWPASLYLEGSDQHRGWFQSSLLESVGTRGRAPYDAVLTHGFILTADGHKMSKSLGNDIGPQKIVDQYGADILRLWVAAIDYTEDVRIGEEILKGQVDAYRKIRNTLRYLLGNLAGFDEAEKLPQDQMPELERWVLHRLTEIDASIRRACNDYEFNRMFQELYRFCSVDLSAVYFDIRKDTLYCDPKESIRRRAARTVLDQLFSCLTAWFAPLMCFTAEETWLTRFPSDEDSVHLRQFPAIPAEWRDEPLGKKWEKIRTLRRVVTGALEVERREKRIGASLQAAPHVYVEDASYIGAMKGVDLAEIAITSGGKLIHGAPPEGAFMLEEIDGIGVVNALAEGDKCQRCWQVLSEVGTVAEAPDLCCRCAGAVHTHEAA